ncbi:MAG: ATP-binding protein [Syntrophobacteraceae bacterium]|jgi:nitrogen-specific signal transduction histidine kinase/CheY-like chemotaxis protein
MKKADRKKIDAELLNAKKLEATGVLAGGIAHDFNNLLFVIMGNINMAQLKIEDDHEAQKHLIEAEKACLRAKDLTQKFITFSSGGGPVKRLVSMSDLVSSVVSLVLSGSITSSEIDTPSDLWLVEVDENQIRQVFTGILENARESMPRGGIVSIRAENVEIDAEIDAEGIAPNAGRYVKVVISDEGIGISEENMPKVFDPYFSTKYRGNQKGMGFGLAIAHSVIKKHNGSIEVESIPGKGTTVSILIPASAAKGDVLPGTPSLVLLPRKRILVMEDEGMLGELIQTMLEHLGYEVDTALDGERAIELYSEAVEAGRDYDAVILDLTVKVGMNGGETIRKLQYLNPNVRAIISSGHPNDPIMSDYAEYGFCDALTKPYDLERLQVALDRAFGW